MLPPDRDQQSALARLPRTPICRVGLYPSGLATHVLNYFEFESHHLTQRQKSLCIGFLKAQGDQFTHFHSQQVVAELREGDYLK
jgi:hypothetical protein